MVFAMVPAVSIAYMCIGTVIFTIVPIVIAIIWLVKKKEKVTTILAGCAVFVLIAMIIEKCIQNVLIFPTVMGLKDHAISIFVNDRPLLWAFLVALFPGVFEETGRLIAFKTVLKKRRNRETSISYGIGHGGTEVVLLLGLTYLSYIMYAVMINSGMFEMVINEVAAQTPDQVDTLCEFAESLAVFSLGDLLIGVAERIFAVLFHIGASILVFYACRDKGRFILYPLAIILHTALDGVAALQMKGLIQISAWGLEGAVALFGIAVFFGSYFLLYAKDKNDQFSDTLSSTGL